jgi:hypothetical protein
MKTKANWKRMVVAIMAAQTLAVFCSTVASAQGPIANGETLIGTIAPAGDSDSWTFSANAGDAIVVRVGEVANTAFTPKI